MPPFPWYTMDSAVSLVPSSDTQFKPQDESLDPKAICCKFDRDTAAKLRAMPDRSAFIRQAVEQALNQLGQ